jgi:DNA-binding MarR family transcriptional regulator
MVSAWKHLPFQHRANPNWALVQIALAEAEKRPIHVGQVRELTTMSLPAVSRMISVQVKAGMVERHTLIQDTRRTYLSLTAKGRRKMKLVLDAMAVQIIAERRRQAEMNGSAAA